MLVPNATKYFYHCELETIFFYIIVKGDRPHTVTDSNSWHSSKIRSNKGNSGRKMQRVVRLKTVHIRILRFELFLSSESIVGPSVDRTNKSSVLFNYLFLTNGTQLDVKL